MATTPTAASSLSLSEVTKKMPAPKEGSSTCSDSAPLKRPRLDGKSGSLRAMTSKQYLDECVMPIMLKALSAVNKERPADPVDYLIQYFTKEKQRGLSSSPEKSEALPPPSTPTAPTSLAKPAEELKPNE